MSPNLCPFFSCMTLLSKETFEKKISMRRMEIQKANIYPVTPNQNSNAPAGL